MQGEQRLSQLLLMEQQVAAAFTNWPDDEYIRSLANQASARIGEVRAHKQQALEELAQIEGTLSNARSSGQLRLMEEQANALGADFPADTEIHSAIERMALIAHGRLQVLESTCSALKELASRITNAQTLAEAENYARDAARVAADGGNFEEVDDLLRKVQRLIEERKKDYVRIERNLRILIEGSVRATGPAELDLILARRRDLVKKYPAEGTFQELQEEAGLFGPRANVFIWPNLKPPRGRRKAFWKRQTSFQVLTGFR